MSDIDQSMDFLRQFAGDALSKAGQLAGRPTWLDVSNQNIGFSYTANKPSIEKPPKLSDILNDFDTQDVEVTLLNDAAERWIAKYLPNIGSAASMHPDAWVDGILSGREPFGLNKDAFDAAWHEGRDRAYRQAGTEKAQIDAMYSVRGFGLPSGAHITAMTAAEIRASDTIADIHRQQTIKDAEIKLELIKFAVQTATQLKTALMSMLASFFGNIVSLAKHEPGADKMRAKAQAYSAFISGLSNYYDVELGFEKLRLEAARTQSGVSEANAKIRADGAAKGIDSRNSAIGAIANGFAQAAGSAANAQSSLQAELFSGQL